MRVALALGIVATACGGPDPTRIVADAGNPGALAVDATSLYWADRASGAILTASKNGGVGSVLFADEPTAGPMFVDDTYLYWMRTTKATTGTGDIVRAPLAGGTPAVVASQVDLADALQLLGDDSTLYWIAIDQIYAVAKDGSAPAYSPTDGLYLSSLSLDDTYFYYLDGTIAYRHLKSGGQREVLFDTGPTKYETFGLAVLPDRVFYWKDYECGDEVYCNKLVRADLTSGATEVLLDINQGVSQIFVHAGQLYWQQGGSLMHMSATADGPDEISTHMRVYTPLAFDDKFAYWPSGTSIVRASL